MVLLRNQRRISRFALEISTQRSRADSSCRHPPGGPALGLTISVLLSISGRATSRLPVNDLSTTEVDLEGVPCTFPAILKPATARHDQSVHGG